MHCQLACCACLATLPVNSTERTSYRLLALLCCQSRGLAVALSSSEAPEPLPFVGEESASLRAACALAGSSAKIFASRGVVYLLKRHVRV